jgi:DNA-binding LytR/AlgR family response regulator
LFIEKEGGRKVPVLPEEIFFFEARDDYAMLHTYDQRFLILGSLKKLEERLARYGFFRVHRKYLVNLNKISEVIPLSRGVILLRIGDLAKSEILVSRRKAKLLRKVLKF